MFAEVDEFAQQQFVDWSTKGRLQQAVHNGAIQQCGDVTSTLLI